MELFLFMKIGSDYLCFLFLDHYKEVKSLPLAPIAVEILVCRGSAHKIATDSGTNGSEST